MKLRSIQFLRAIAVILVLYAHSIDLQLAFSHSSQEHFFYLQNFGAFGVDLFFVVSGFVISMVSQPYHGLQQGFHFLGRRFIRLNPVYYLATAPMLLLLLRLQLAPPDIFGPNGPLWKSLFLLPFFDGTRWVDPILSVGWSLSFEWLFYIQFFLAILFMPLKKEWFIAVLITGMVVWGMVFKPDDARWIFLTAPIQFEFLLGLLIFSLYHKTDLSRSESGDPDPGIRRLAILCLLTGIGICLYRIINGFGDDLEAMYLLDGSKGVSRVLHWGPAAGLIVAGFVFLDKYYLKKSQTADVSHPTPDENRDKNPKRFSGNISQKISATLLLCGDASYSIYLTHTISYLVLNKFYRRFGFPPAPDLMIFAQTALALFAGVLFYKWVERPLLRWLRKN